MRADIDAGLKPDDVLKVCLTEADKSKRSVCTVLTGDLTSPFATGSVRVFSRGINLVSVDFFCPCALDSLVEPLEQLSQRLAGSSLQHGQSIVTVGGDRYTSHGIERAHGDFAIGDKLSYVR